MHDIGLQGSISSLSGVFCNITIIAPIIQSKWLLEAAHANAADVFVFWLASSVTLWDLFAQGTAAMGFLISLTEAVISMFNKHYKEFFANEIYFVALVLDPSALQCTTPALDGYVMLLARTPH